MSCKRSLFPRLALLGAALIWGSSFIVVKDTVDVLPPNLLLALRFTIAAILLCIVFFPRLRKLNRSCFVRGAAIGFLLFCAYSSQTLGITGTTPGKNAFLTAIYCVLVPFLFWAVDKSRPEPCHFLAAFLCIAGIGLVSLTGQFTIEWGDALTLLGGFFYAAHIVAVAKLGKEQDPILLTIVQFGWAAVFSWIVTLLFEPFPTVWTAGSLAGVAYLAVFATAVALLFQNIGQAHTPPAAASILLSLEAVFGVLFSVLFYKEQLTVRLVFGFVLIFLAVILSETKLSFLRPKRAGTGQSPASPACSDRDAH